MKKIGDIVRVQDMFAGLKDHGASAAAPAQAATIFSAPFQLGEAREYAAVFNVLHVSSVGPREAVTAKLLLGTTTYASPTAYSSIGGFSCFTICASGATQTKVNYAYVAMTGTATKVDSGCDGITIQTTDTTSKTIAFSNTANSSLLVHTTSASVAAAKLATCITNCFPELDSTYYWLGASTGPGVVEIWHKHGKTFDITSSSIPVAASADAIGMAVARCFMYEFKEEDINAAISATGTTMAYDHFVFKTHSTGTVVRIHGNLLMGESRYRPCINIGRDQAATVSSGHTS